MSSFNIDTGTTDSIYQPGPTDPASGTHGIAETASATIVDLEASEAGIIDLAGRVTAEAWPASTAVKVRQLALGTNGTLAQCTVAGTTSATEPTWPTSVGGTVTDGGATWKALAIPGSGSGAYAGGMTVTTQGGTAYTLQLSDAGSEIEFTSGSAASVTVPPHSSVAFKPGTVIVVRQTGTGTVTAVGGAGVTVSGTTATQSQYGTVTLVQSATPDVWYATAPAPGATSGILKVQEYFPATQTTYTATTTLTDLDAVNAAVTFTAPPSGRVTIETSGMVQGSSGTVYAWAIRDTSNTAWGNAWNTDYGGSNIAGDCRTGKFYVIGLTPGQSYTMKWAHQVSYGSGSPATIAYVTPGPGLLMVVTAAV